MVMNKVIARQNQAMPLLQSGKLQKFETNHQKEDDEAHYRQMLIQSMFNNGNPQNNNPNPFIKNQPNPINIFLEPKNDMPNPFIDNAPMMQPNPPMQQEESQPNPFINPQTNNSDTLPPINQNNLNFGLKPQMHPEVPFFPQNDIGQMPNYNPQPDNPLLQAMNQNKPPFKSQGYDQNNRFGFGQNIGSGHEPMGDVEENSSNFRTEF